MLCTWIPIPIFQVAMKPRSWVSLFPRLLDVVDPSKNNSAVVHDMIYSTRQLDDSDEEMGVC